MATGKFTMGHDEVQQAIAAYITQETGLRVMPEEVAIYDASETDNPHPRGEIEISATATTR